MFPNNILFDCRQTVTCIEELITCRQLSASCHQLSFSISKIDRSVIYRSLLTIDRSIDGHFHKSSASCLLLASLKFVSTSFDLLTTQLQLIEQLVSSLPFSDWHVWCVPELPPYCMRSLSMIGDAAWPRDRGLTALYSSIIYVNSRTMRGPVRCVLSW
jgi:hypothetical protein